MTSFYARSQLRRRMNKEDNLEQRFWYYVDNSRDSSICWAWLGMCGTEGYGDFKFKGKRYRAHRVSYQIHKGPIPNKQLVCHTCDNRWCVNPTHLFLGTDAVNTRDRDIKGRTAKGVRNGNATVSVAQVLQIRGLYRQGVRQAEIARRVGVGIWAVFHIVHGKTWGHIHEEALTAKEATNG